MAGAVLGPEVTTDEAEAAARDAREAVSGPLVLTAAEGSWTLSPADLGSALDVARQDGMLSVSLDRDRLRAELADAYADLTVEPVEAGYDTVGGSDATPKIAVTPSHKGRSIDEERLFGAIEKGLFEGQREHEVPVVTDAPELATAEVARMKPTDLLGSYRTNYAVVPDDGTRVENLGISSDAVDGTLLAPGEVFSMNAHVSGLDYNESKVIVGGEETTADGGGLCQVTSTLYNAANFAGLDVLERTPHSAQLPYIRPGMDATVWWGGPGKADDLDMKFRNTTDGYLLLRERVAEDGYVYAEIWGRPNGTEVEMSSKPTYLGEDGSEWVTSQTVKKDGEVIFDGVLHRDTYEPLVDQHGKEIPPPEVPVAPVDP
jgi:vancomycin resistance protein YoaR